MKQGPSDSLQWTVMISEEDLALVPGTMLDYSELSCGRSFIIVKKDRENFWKKHQKGVGEWPPSLVLRSPYIPLPDPLPQHTS